MDDRWKSWVHDAECWMGGRSRGPGGGPGGGGGPFGGFPWSFFKGGGGRRARRGDIRAGILALLAEQPRNGYQIMQQLEQRSGGAWRPSPGSIYPALQQLEDEGLVRAETAGSGRTFHLTDAGRAYVHAHKDETSAPWEAFGQENTGDDVQDLMHGMKQVMGAVVQVSQAGSPAQIAQAKHILAEARRGLYGLLAEDGD